jgi:hypothetical protein
MDTYDITSNRESGLGKYDVLLVPKTAGKRGIILEFKVAKTKKSLQDVASQGLTQILEQRYADRFLNAGEVLIIGMAFWKKHVHGEFVVVKKATEQNFFN